MRQLLIQSALALTIVGGTMTIAHAQISSSGAGGSSAATTSTGVSGASGVGVGTGRAGTSAGVNVDGTVNTGGRLNTGTTTRNPNDTVNNSRLGTEVNGDIRSRTTNTQRDSRVDTGVGVDANVGTRGVVDSSTRTIRNTTTGATRTIRGTTNGVMGSVTDTIDSPIGASSTTRTTTRVGN